MTKGTSEKLPFSKRDMDLSIAADKQLLLGARTLEGLNLRFDAARPN